MKKFPNDPLRDQLGTARFHYVVVSGEGLRMEGWTRSMRMTAEQFTRFQDFLKELYKGSPEIEAAAQTTEEAKRG